MSANVRIGCTLGERVNNTSFHHLQPHSQALYSALANSLEKRPCLPLVTFPPKSGGKKSTKGWGGTKVFVAQQNNFKINSSIFTGNSKNLLFRHTMPWKS